MSAVTEDALYTISRPKHTITTTVKNRVQSVRRRCAIVQPSCAILSTISLNTRPRCSKLSN